ncbi:MAG: ABC-type transport auxiliary lipoprotein family protein [Lysobacterales bacterium]
MSRNRSKLVAVLCVLATTSVLSACSGLTQSDKPAITVWWLEPYTGMTRVDSDDPPVPVKLTVTAVPGLDNDRVLTLSADAELKPYAGARWADDLPELVSSLIGRSLQASGKFELVQNLPRKDSAGCDVQLELQAFFADRDVSGGTTGVRTAVGGHIRCGAAAPVLVHTDTRVAVGAESMNAVVAAFQQATDKLTQDIINKIQ